MHNSNLKIQHRCPGRAVHVEPDGTLYIARKYAIHASKDDGKSWSHVATMPYALKRRIGALTRMTSRLLRVEVRAAMRLSDGRFIAANREGVCFLDTTNRQMVRSQVDSGNVDWWPPMTISRGPNDLIVWGEYGGNPQRRSVRLFASDDGGKSFHVAFSFPAGEIRHIHNLYFDASLDKYWVLSGDHDHEPGIGLLSRDFRDLEWVVKGDQTHRAVEVFDFGDRLVYGTDTEMAPNAVMSLDKATGKVRRVAETDGSCIYAGRFGDTYAITTSVEPSEVNACRDAKLLLSRDGETWHEVFSAPKDRWNENYFQFGSLVLPRGNSDRNTIMFSGQALRGIDGSVNVGQWVIAE